MEKGRVVSEIQRIATEIGRAPGISIFEQYSGIPRRDVIGKLWARWSEALAEAGFEAHSFETERYDEAQLLDAIAKACISLNRWPSPNDLRLHARQNPGFPSTTTIENRFPRRALLVEAMRIWAKSNDASGLILTWLPSQTHVGQPERRVASEGHVYLLRAGEFYKIGRSDEIERRVKEIRISLPQSAILEHTITTDDPSGIEAYWHRRFAAQRANGEWFKLDKADVLAFKRRKFQ